MCIRDRYKKEDGVWKFAGLSPDIRWGEYDFDQIFAEGRDEHGEEVKAEAGAISAGAEVKN